MDSEAEEPQPSTSNQSLEVADKKLEDSGINVDKELDRLLTVEEFLLKSKTFMLEYEKHMFSDTLDADCLVVSARYVSTWIHLKLL